jgi:hypothetical protein
VNEPRRRSLPERARAPSSDGNDNPRPLMGEEAAALRCAERSRQRRSCVTNCRRLVGADLAPADRLGPFGFDAEIAMLRESDLIPLIYTATEIA